jgi:hypothetical protein
VDNGESGLPIDRDDIRAGSPGMLEGRCPFVCEDSEVPRLSRLPALVVGLALLPALAERAAATDYFVDNRIGSDGNDGRTARPLSRRTGPVKSISRALALCDGGDRVIVVNNPGTPYYETLHLFGGAHSGEPGAEFEIEGNGAVVCGLRTIPDHAWRYVADNLWRLHTARKGHVMLFVDGELLPRRDETRNGFLPSDLEPGTFCVFEGLTYYRGDAAHRPPDMNFAFAHDDVGLTCYHVHDVRIRDLHFRHFRLDGIAAPDSARRIVLDEVSTAGNGRAGLSVGGVSMVILRGGDVRDNVGASIRIEGTAAVEVVGTTLDVEPTVVP